VQRVKGRVVLARENDGMPEGLKRTAGEIDGHGDVVELGRARHLLDHEDGPVELLDVRLCGLGGEGGGTGPRSGGVSVTIRLMSASATYSRIADGESGTGSGRQVGIVATASPPSRRSPASSDRVVSPGPNDGCGTACNVASRRRAR
jgi:hypothetical protein